MPALERVRTRGEPVVIGVISGAEERAVVEEFFQLFKTPWEFYRQGRRYDVVVVTTDEVPAVDTKLLLIYGSEIKPSDKRDGVTIDSRRPGGSLNYGAGRLPIYGQLLTFQRTGAGIPCVTADAGVAGLKLRSPDFTLIRLGYDVFQEIRVLLSAGQPPENAHVPTLDIHIMMLREWILNAGIPLVEIPAAPAGHDFVVCLTHDIDFVGIRNHRFDHSMWGFLYRSTVGAVRNFVRCRISILRLLKIWRAVASLPFVYLGWARDFWDPFGWYLRVERDLPTTYFLIPFKGRPGRNVSARHRSRRAAAYDITDLPQWTAALMRQGCELGVHGIDAWNSVASARAELARIVKVTGEPRTGIRMHWLLRDENTFHVLEEAGYSYDSSLGYNETIGYRSGTTQAFRPLGVQALLELPMHIQDGALFFSHRLDLSEQEAWKRCQAVIDNARKLGGVLTILWHDRSHGPERFWGEFYARVVVQLKSLGPWFGTAAQVVNWFRQRRHVAFEFVRSRDGADQLKLRHSGDGIDPPLNIRVYSPGSVGRGRQGRGAQAVCTADFAWTGKSEIDLGQLLRRATDPSPAVSDPSAVLLAEASEGRRPH